MNLPDMAKIEEIFLAKARNWANIVKGKDVKSFAQRMNDLKLKFGQEDPDFADAYKNVYRLLGEKERP